MTASVELLFENNNASSSSMWQCIHNVEGVKFQHRFGLQHKKGDPVTASLCAAIGNCLLHAGTVGAVKSSAGAVAHVGTVGAVKGGAGAVAHVGNGSHTIAAMPGHLEDAAVTHAKANGNLGMMLGMMFGWCISSNSSDGAKGNVFGGRVY